MFLLERCQQIIKRLQQPNFKFLIVKVEEIEKLDEDKFYKYNSFLYTLCYFKILKFGSLLYKLPEDIYIFLEVSNTANNHLKNKLPVLNALHHTECKFSIEYIDPSFDDYNFQVFGQFISQIIENPGRDKKQYKKRLSFPGDPLKGNYEDHYNHIEPNRIQNKETLRRIVTKYFKEGVKREANLSFKGRQIKHLLTYRNLMNFLKFVNFQFKIFNNNTGITIFKHLMKKRIEIFELLMNLSIKQVISSQEARDKQEMAENESLEPNSPSQQLSRTRNKKNKPHQNSTDAISFSDMTHSFLFPLEDTFCFIYKKLSNEKDHLLLNILRPVKQGNAIDVLDPEALQPFLNKKGLLTNKYGAFSNKDLETIMKEFTGVLDYGDYKEHDFLERIYNLFEVFKRTKWSLKEYIAETKNFGKDGKGYTVNMDNFFKIMLIHQKIKANIPFVILGQTGCGKTYLLEYYSQVIMRGEVEFFKEVLHAGISEGGLIDFIKDKIRLQTELGRRFMVFFFVN